MRIRVIYILLDYFLIVFSFFLVILLRGQDPFGVFAQRFQWFAMLLGLHLPVALYFDKYNFGKRHGLKKELLPIVKTNGAFTGLVSIFLVLMGVSSISRVMFFGTVLLASLLELLMGAVVNHFRSLSRQGFTLEPGVTSSAQKGNGSTLAARPEETNAEADLTITQGHNGNDHPRLPVFPAMPHEILATSCRKEKPKALVLETPSVATLKERQPKTANARTFKTLHGMIIRQSIVEEMGSKVFDFLQNNVPLGTTSIVLATNTRLNILNLPFGYFKTIVNLHKANDHRYMNKFFEAVNTKLSEGGIFSGCCETLEIRKQRLKKRFSPLFGSIIYVFDFLIHRVVPKINLSRRLYFSVTKGKNRAISRAEVLGRLYACGFSVVREKQVNGLLFFVARKKERPVYDFTPTYGPLIRLSRVGKGGKVISVYKLRTMYPYSEYLQHYVFDKHDLCAGGKFNNDFRVSTLGKILRKTWIDELPMLVNLMRGELKLVGVRPLSQHYFSLYSPELQKRRMEVTPGLIPPFYADLPKTLEEIEASEMRYLDSYEKHPFLTDMKYFWKAMVNILFRHARSS